MKVIKSIENVVNSTVQYPGQGRAVNLMNLNKHFLLIEKLREGGEKKRKNLDGISIKGVLTSPPLFFAFLDELDHLEAKKKN